MRRCSPSTKSTKPAAFSVGRSSRWSPTVNRIGRRFAREAERLISQEQVCTIFGCWSSAGRKMVKPVVEAHDHLLLYPVQYEGLETSPAIVYLGAAPNQQILPAVDWAVHTLHKKRFFLIGSDYVFPRAANAIIKDHLKSLGGEVAGEKYIPLGSSSTDAAVAAIVQAKPDMILNTINGDSNITFFRDLRAAGVKSATTPTLSFSISEQGLRSLGANVLAGDYSAYTYFQSLDTPENRDFVRKFHDKYPQRAVTDPMETAYVGVKLWALAVKEAQSLDPKRIRRSILTQKVMGPGGEVRIDPDTQHAYRTPRIAQVQPGRPIQGHLVGAVAGETGTISAHAHGRSMASILARPVYRLGKSVGGATVMVATVRLRCLCRLFAAGSQVLSSPVFSRLRPSSFTMCIVPRTRTRGRRGENSFC